jgi:glycosyltransferase 2 family protein
MIVKGCATPSGAQVSTVTVAHMRQLALIAVKLAVSVTLLHVAVSGLNFASIGERLGQLDPRWLLAAFLVALLQVALVAVRWRRVVLACGAELAPLRALRFNLIAMFFNQVLPSTVGGDAARIWLLARSGAGWSKATYSVLIDRFIGVLMLAVAVTAGLYSSFALIQNPVGRIALLVVGLGSLSAAAVFLASANWSWFRDWRPTRHLAKMSTVARTVLFSRTSGLAVAAISLLVHILTAVLAWSLARAVGAPLDLLHAFLLVLPVMLIATVPISIAGWGVRESTLVLAFSYAGLPEADGLIVSVLLGAAMIAVGIIGGMVWLASSEDLRISTAWRRHEP